MAMRKNFIDKIKNFKLKNGLNVVFFEKNDLSLDLPILNVNLWVKIGSKNETSKNSGISHFLEHILFKNTKNYPKNLISKEIENIGGQMNAATSYDFTHYYITLHSDDAEKAFSVISDMAFNLEIENESFAMEKGVIIEEIQMYKDRPENILWEEIYKNIFGLKNHVYSRQIIGSKENILKMTPKDLKNYYDAFYTPANMTLFVAGKIDFKKLKILCEKYFDLEKKSGNSIENIENFCFDTIPKKQNFFYHEKIMDTINQTYFAYSWIAPNIDKIDDFIKSSVLAKILGEGTSSQLHKTLKQDLSLVWSIGSSISEQKHGCIFVIYGICDYKNLEKIEEQIFKTLSNLEKNIKQDDLEKIKNIANFDFALDFETVSDITDNLGYFEAMKNWRNFFDLKYKLDELKLEDILYAKNLIFGKIDEKNKTEKMFVRQIIKPKNL